MRDGTRPLLGAPFAIERDNSVDGPDGRTVSDLIPTRRIAKTIRESAEKTLIAAYERAGIPVTPALIAEFAREIGNNAAAIVGLLEVDS